MSLVFDRINAIAGAAGLRAPEKAVLYALQTWIRDDPEGACWPGSGTLAIAAGLTRARLFDDKRRGKAGVLTRLVEKGVLHIEARHRPGTREKTSNRYIVDYAALVKLAPPPPSRRLRSSPGEQRGSLGEQPGSSPGEQHVVRTGGQEQITGRQHSRKEKEESTAPPPAVSVVGVVSDEETFMCLDAQAKGLQRRADQYRRQADEARQRLEASKGSSLGEQPTRS